MKCPACGSTRIKLTANGHIPAHRDRQGLRCTTSGKPVDSVRPALPPLPPNLHDEGCPAVVAS